MQMTVTVPDVGDSRDIPIVETSGDAPAPAGDVNAEVVVIGAGPGGYSAAFRAADLGKTVVLVDRGPTLGGVCLNVGCIPSKALLHAARVMDEAEEMAENGLRFGPPKVDLDRLRGWKDQVVGRLTGGLDGLARRRKVRVIRGIATFVGPNRLTIRTEDGAQDLRFTSAIIATGSEPIPLPFLPDDPRIIDSTGALALADIPGRLLVIGGGVIGMELGQVYRRFGSAVSVVEMAAQLIPGSDPDIVAPLTKRSKTQFAEVMLNTRVTACRASDEALTVTFEHKDDSFERNYDRILVAVGRRPNGAMLGLDRAGVQVDAMGFVPVDPQQRTNVPHILAVGDIVGQPMLAHKAVHEGHVAAEVLAGHKAAFDTKVIPSVAYTDPEIAWVGETETSAKAKGLAVACGQFPWMASGRSLTMGRSDGLTKLLFDPQTRRILGAGIAGQGAGDLIAEVALAIEMGADVDDIALTVHPHPTLSETIGLAAEAFAGTITDL